MSEFIKHILNSKSSRLVFFVLVIGFAKFGLNPKLGYMHNMQWPATIADILHCMIWLAWLYIFVKNTYDLRNDLIKKPDEKMVSPVGRLITKDID